MERLVKLIFPVLFVIVSVASYFTYKIVTANNMDQLLSGDEPFAVNLVLQDSGDKTVVQMAQMVVFPAEKHVLYYFINSDASFTEEEGALRSLPPDTAGRFSGYTEVKSPYYVYLDTDSLARWIDIVEGIPYFLEEPLVLEQSDFQYPQGFHKFSGKQFVDFITSRVRADHGKEYLTGVERVYRTESAILTLFWNRSIINGRVSDSALRLFAFSLFNTNMNADEMGSITSYLLDKKGINSSVLEVPLELVEKGTYYRPEHLLLVKEKRAKSIYRQFVEDLESGKFRSDTFSVEVLNGTEINGLARKMQQYVQDRGPLVLDTNNYLYKPHEETLIIDRSGNVFNAEKLSEIMKIKPEYIFFRRANLEVNVTLLLGNDIDRKKFHL